MEREKYSFADCVLDRWTPVFSVLTMAKNLTIEDHFNIIEQSIEVLESGELGLEESLARYEAGLKAMRLAKALLDKYAARLEDVRSDEKPSDA
jgi:exodeoxyribonuclease VII small subunit